MDSNTFGFIIVGLLIFLGVVFIYWRLRKNFKFLNVPSIALITGAPKTGKDLLCVKLALKDFKKIHRKWAIKKWFRHLLFKRSWFVNEYIEEFDTYEVKYLDEEPLFYTNASVSFKSLKAKKPHKLDKCIRKLELVALLRLKRFNYKSVIYISEASLVSDNQFINDQDANVELSLFCKLIAHETRGGKCYLNTQSILDLHYSWKRVSSVFYFIQKSLNFGLFHVLYVREMISNDLGTNSFIDDVDTTTRKVIIPFWYHNKYDRYEFSYLTDDLEHSSEYFIKNGLVSFNKKYIEKADKRKKEDID